MLITDDNISVREDIVQRLSEEINEERSSQVEHEQLNDVQFVRERKKCYECDGPTLLCSLACLPISTKVSGETVKKKPAAYKNLDWLRNC